MKKGSSQTQLNPFSFAYNANYFILKPTRPGKFQDWFLSKDYFDKNTSKSSEPPINSPSINTCGTVSASATARSVFELGP